MPIVGTQLLWASNTTNDVLIDTTQQRLLRAARRTLVQVVGDWPVRGPSLPSNALPPDFAQIPPTSLAGAVLPSVAGTPQAQEAAIANTIPQTATVPLKNGPKFTPSFDGPPQYSPIPGTPLTYVVEFVGAGHPGQPDELLRGDRGRVVHRDAVDRAVGGRELRCRP